jgi:MFS family permease
MRSFSVPPQADSRPRASRVALSAVFLVSGTGIGLWSAHIPVVQASLGLSKQDLGIALLVMSLGAVLLMPLTGFIAARLGSARATVLTALAYIVVVPLPVLVDSFSALLVVVLLFGAAFGAMDVAMNTHATRLEERWGAPIMSSFHGFYSLGGLFGALLGGGIVAIGLGDGLGIVLVAVAPLPALALVARYIGPGTDRPAASGPVLALPRGPAVLLGALAFLGFMAEGSVLDWSAVYLVESGASVPVAASGYASFSIAMLLCRFTGDAVVARFGRAVVLCGSGLLVALGLAILVAAPIPFIIMIGFAVVGIGAANIVPVLFTLSGRLPGISAAYGVASVATPGYGGLLVGPAMIGFVAELAGLRVSFVLLTLLGLLLAAGGYVVARRHEGH